MKKQLLVTLLALSGVVFAGASSASTVVGVDAIYGISGGTSEQIVTPGSAVHYYEFNVGQKNVKMDLTLVDTAPDYKPVTYTLYEDLSKGTLLPTFQATIGTALKTFSAVDSTGVLSVMWNLLAGRHYVLGIDAGDRTVATITNVSAVPVPGAALLFGTAVLGAGVFGRKNKASKKEGFAAVAA